jgi:integrase/recombinase XerD
MINNKDTLIKQYIAQLNNRKLSLNTKRLYIRVYKSFLDWLVNTEGELELKKIDKKCLLEYKLFASRSLSLSSISTYLKILAKEFDINLVEKKKASQLQQLPKCLAEFPKWLFLKGMSENTIMSYLKKTLAFISWFETNLGQEFVPSRITNYDILQFRSWLQEQRRAPAGINSLMFAISAFCKFGKDKGLMKFNPIDEIVDLALPLNSQHEAKWIDTNKQYALMREVKEKSNFRDLALLLILLDCGLRESELTNLQPEDIIMNPVNKARIEVKYSKQKKSRSVPIESRRLRQALNNYIKECLSKNSEYFFPNSQGKKMTTRNVQKIVKKYAIKAGIPEVTPHTLRHCFAKNLINTGKFSLDEIAILMGHFKKNGLPNINTVIIYTAPVMDETRQKMKQRGY